MTTMEQIRCYVDARLARMDREREAFVQSTAKLIAAVERMEQSANNHAATRTSKESSQCA